VDKNSPLIVVTGATGFVGRYVVQQLLREDYDVACLVRNLNDLESFPDKNKLRFIKGDITSLQSLDSAFKEAHAVINLAGMREFWSRDRTDFYNINQHGAINVFNTCLNNNVERVIQVSTPLSYGVPKVIPFNEHSKAENHCSEYAKSKFIGDQAGYQMHQEKGWPLSIVYLAAVIGSGDSKPTMEVERAVTGNMPALVGADTTYTYSYVKDAAKAIVQTLLKDDAIGKRYLVGKERATTREYFDIIGEIANVKIPKYNVPEKLLLPIAKVMEMKSRLTGRRPELPLDVLKTTMAGSLLFDASLSERELKLEYTPLRVALQDAVNDFIRI